MADKTGGPAFPAKLPLSSGEEPYAYFGGMTLRDYFAAQAMAGLHLKWDGAYSAADRNRGDHLQDAKWVAAAAYRYADAMLVARGDA